MSTMLRGKLYKIYVDTSIPLYGGNVYFCEAVEDEEHVTVFYINDNLYGSFHLSDAVVEIIQIYEAI